MVDPDHICVASPDVFGVDICDKDVSGDAS